MEVKRTERGWGGHFIGGDNCKFRRNTLLEYGIKKWIVSTVGNYTFGDNTIGLGRYYETMVFKAYKDRMYWDADVSEQIFFDSNWALDKLDYNSDLEANEMHEKSC